MKTPIQQKIEHKKKEIKLLQFIIKAIYQIKEHQNSKKEEQTINNIEQELNLLCKH